MSGTTPAPPHPGFDPNANPKAAAKAAKAYAKASRPWFKKKRWWALGVIVLIIIISVATSGGNDGPKVVDNGGSSSSVSNQADTGSAKTGGKAELGSKENPARVGQTVELAGTRYTVKKAKAASKIGDPSMFGARANGTFVIVTLTIENMKNETKTFMQDATKFLAPSGASYSPDSNGTTAAMGTNKEPLWLADMQPRLPKTGVIVFDVPPSALKGGLLEVSDLFGEGSAYINLGLR